MVEEKTFLKNHPHAPQTERVALLVEYHGQPYAGSQFQSHKEEVIPTVQSTLENALRQLNLTVSAVHFSGRTDAGVNARGQVAHFDILQPDGLKNIPRLAASLNAVLPETVSVKAVALNVNHQFHSQLSATHRWYRYTILNHPERSALAPRDSVWIKSPLDTERMNQAASELVGTHNFKNVKCLDSDTTNDICHISHASVRKEGNLVIFDIVANRFLYKMVRNLMGLLINIGRANDLNRDINRSYAPGTVLTAIAQEDRARSSWETAKAEGLSLMAVLYPEAINYFQTDEYVQILEQLLLMESMQDENLYRQAS